jgi:hypothetical protein
MASFGLIGMAGGIGGEMVKQADEERKTAANRDFETWRMEVLQSYKIGEEQRAETRAIAGEKRGLVNRATERQTIVDETVANAPKLREVKVGDRKAEKLAEYDPEVTAARIDTESASARAKADVDRETITDQGNDPNYVAAIRRIAQAKHVEGLGSIAQAELARMGIKEKQANLDLILRFENATDPAEKAKIKESLTVRGIIKPGEFDTEKVTEESYDAQGNLVKRERTQKRRPDGSAAPAAKQDVRVAGQVIGQASTPEEARELVAKFKAGKSEAPKQPAAVSGGTSGSHTPAAGDDSQERRIRAQIVEKRNRASLRGIDPDVKAELLLEVRELESKLNGKSVLR